MKFDPDAVVALARLLVALATAVVGHFVTIGRLKDKIHSIELDVREVKGAKESDRRVADLMMAFLPLVGHLMVKNKKRRRV